MTVSIRQLSGSAGLSCLIETTACQSPAQSGENDYIHPRRGTDRTRVLSGSTRVQWKHRYTFVYTHTCDIVWIPSREDPTWRYVSICMMSICHTQHPWVLLGVAFLPLFQLWIFHMFNPPWCITHMYRKT